MGRQVETGHGVGGGAVGLGAGGFESRGLILRLLGHSGQFYFCQITLAASAYFWHLDPLSSNSSLV